MNEENDSIIKEKPMRGREMKTQIVPEDDKVGIYHEGYVDDKHYLVPDENLNIMRDDVDTQIRTRGIQALTGHQRDSFQFNDYERAERKLSAAVDKESFFQYESEDNKPNEEEKVDYQEKEAQREDKKDHGDEEDIKSEEEEKHEEIKSEEEEDKHSDEEEIKSDEEEKNGDEEEIKSEEEEVKDDNMQEQGEDDEGNDEEEKERSEDIEEKIGDEGEKYIEEEAEEKETPLEEEMVEEDNQAQEEPLVLPAKPTKQPQPGVDRLRLLISGHVRKDQKPIYIVQEFREEQDLFKDQKADFEATRKLSEDGIDAFIAGRFYDESILEETSGKPVALNVKSHKILIDENKSNVFDDYFEQVYNFESVDILLAGEFLKSDITKRITPFLSLAVETAESPGKMAENVERNGGKTNSKTVFTCKLQPTVPFSDKF